MIEKKKINDELEPESIHSKSWSPWSPDNFDFSAKRLSENAKIIRFALLVELNTANHLQVLLKSQIKHINTASADLFALRMCAWKLPNCNLAPSPKWQNLDIFLRLLSE